MYEQSYKALIENSWKISTNLSNMRNIVGKLDFFKKELLRWSRNWRRDPNKTIQELIEKNQIFGGKCNIQRDMKESRFLSQQFEIIWKQEEVFLAQRSKVS